jgi:hypothetical protein
MPDLPEIMSVDDGFKGVISRLDPAQLPQQFVSQAVNRVFQDQLIKNRWGIVQPSWGGKWVTSTRTVTVTSGSATTTVVSGSTIPTNSIVCSDQSAVPPALVFPNGTRCILDDNTNCSMSSAAITFVGPPVNRNVQFYGSTAAFTDILGTLPFRDPDTGYQALIVATNEIRTTDGGQGRMYLVRPNQSHLEIPMNGHDIYSPVRMMQATNAVVMLRPGNARYYFTGADVVNASNTVTLNVSPDMASGDRIAVFQVGNSPSLWTAASFTTGQGFGVFVNVKAGGVCTLHFTQGSAQTGTLPLTLSSGLTSANRYYFELSNNTTGYEVTQGVSDFYNDGLPLMMEASYALGLPVSALDNGFNRIASVNAIVASSTADDTITVPNHPFVAGDQVTISNVTVGVSNGIYYIFPTDKNSLKLFSGSSEELDSLNTAAVAEITATIGAVTSTGTAVVSSGTVTSITLGVGGAGYATAPTVAIAAPSPGPGVTATATAIVSGGKVTGFTMVLNGTGYTTAPVVTVTAPAGSGITALTIVNQGAGYVTAPTLTISGTITGATATATITDGKVTLVTITNPGHTASSAVVTALKPSTLTEITSTLVTGTIKKSSASGANVPAGREGLYFQNRLLLLYGPDYLAVSDVLDPLHYSPILNEFKLNTGANDAVVALYPFNATTLIIFKERSILAVENLYGDLSTTRLTEVTREFGCVSQNSIASTGSDIIFLSQRGVISLKQTEYGISQSVVLPLSDPIQDVIEEIDQVNWRKSCAAYFSNRYILSVPVEGGDGTNQRTLVYNFLNQAWEGYWEGALLIPRYYVRLIVAGIDTLCWGDESGYIHNFDFNALQDRNRTGAIRQIATSVHFRGHTGDKNPYSQTNATNNNVDHKQWVNVQFELSCWNPTYSIGAVFDGVNEVYTLSTNETKSRTGYYTYGSGTYTTNNSGDNFLAPYREDYSTLPVIRTNTSGFKAGLVQSFSQKARLRRHSISMQPVVTTTTGALNIHSVKSIAIPFRLYGKTDV